MVVQTRRNVNETHVLLKKSRKKKRRIKKLRIKKHRIQKRRTRNMETQNGCTDWITTWIKEPSFEEVSSNDS